MIQLERKMRRKEETLLGTIEDTFFYIVLTNTFYILAAKYTSYKVLTRLKVRTYVGYDIEKVKIEDTTISKTVAIGQETELCVLL
jgi:hypothetical protein